MSMQADTATPAHIGNVLSQEAKKVLASIGMNGERCRDVNLLFELPVSPSASDAIGWNPDDCSS
jgi:hypothetical protein